MIFWIDAQLSPGLAPWIAETFSVEAKALREIGLRDAADTEIFDAARHEGIALVALIPKHQLGNVVLEALLPEPASWSLQEKGSQAGAWEPAKTAFVTDGSGYNMQIMNIVFVGF